MSKQVVALAERRERVRARSVRVEDELGNWNLFARCMSNDGLIALAIDDAGPALSALANDLLLACYGPRFTVSIHTLLETAKGDQKEGFDIVVHDGDTGESKSVSLMSGGVALQLQEGLVVGAHLRVPGNARTFLAIMTRPAVVSPESGSRVESAAATKPPTQWRSTASTSAPPTRPWRSLTAAWRG